MSIENEKQYEITERWAKVFEEAAKNIKGDDWRSRAEREGCESQAEDLRQQMQDYRDKHFNP